MFVLFQSGCTHVRLGILATRMCVHVCVVIEGTYTCNTGHFLNANFCFCLLCCLEYLQM